ncbi:hypothetical protein [Salipiger mucosus]|uniref:TonB C-terminal domain-containing protein n=1 Tax=Salipiger mucosus DSM 16094 TaxID=1123237 RepID=S9QUE1_9RHOB|nr:hypothetical protein [Salipiger mucosus]EPX84991.1 hypothetical protein Salmuc_00588 [Salipiger mucosus DSM 16094]
MSRIFLSGGLALSLAAAGGLAAAETPDRTTPEGLHAFCQRIDIPPEARDAMLRAAGWEEIIPGPMRPDIVREFDPRDPDDRAMLLALISTVGVPDIGSPERARETLEFILAQGTVLADRAFHGPLYRRGEGFLVLATERRSRPGRQMPPGKTRDEPAPWREHDDRVRCTGYMPATPAYAAMIEASPARQRYASPEVRAVIEVHDTPTVSGTDNLTLYDGAALGAVFDAGFPDIALFQSDLRLRSFDPTWPGSAERGRKVKVPCPAPDAAPGRVTELSLSSDRSLHAAREAALDRACGMAGKLTGAWLVEEARYPGTGLPERYDVTVRVSFAP